MQYPDDEPFEEEKLYPDVDQFEPLDHVVPFGKGNTRDPREWHGAPREDWRSLRVSTGNNLKR